MNAVAHAGVISTKRQPDSLSKIKLSARKLFVDRGYHATRPQDITRDAGLGHGTFYLHYRDKRDCFLAFADDARIEFYKFVHLRAGTGEPLAVVIGRALVAVYEFTDMNPGLLNAAMADDALMDAEGRKHRSLAQCWGNDWAEVIRGTTEATVITCDPEIAGQAIAGAIRQCSIEGDRLGFAREVMIENLTRLLVRAITP